MGTYEINQSRQGGRIDEEKWQLNIKIGKTYSQQWKIEMIRARMEASKR